MEVDKVNIFEMPNNFFYYVAKEVLSQCYSKQVANSFYDFEIIKKGRYKQGNVKVECFNGGAFVSLFISLKSIAKSGQYMKCKKYDSNSILKNALDNLESLPKYYRVSHGRCSTDERCITDIEQAKERIKDCWQMTYSRPLEEPIDWIIKEV